MTSDQLHSHMYSIVCFAASRAIELMDSRRYDEARRCLQDALEEAEDFYIEELEIDLPDGCPSGEMSPEAIESLREWRRELNAQTEEDDYI